MLCTKEVREGNLHDGCKAICAQYMASYTLTLKVT